MRPVGVIAEPVKHDLFCWACGPGGFEQPNVRYAKHAYRVQVYERCVEAIERLRTFSISRVCEAAGGGPTAWSMARHAVHDMAMHGLIRCVQRGARANRYGGRSCYLWEVI